MLLQITRAHVEQRQKKMAAACEKRSRRGGFSSTGVRARDAGSGPGTGPGERGGHEESLTPP